MTYRRLEQALLAKYVHFRTSTQEPQRRKEQLFIERIRSDTYQHENAIDDVIEGGVVTGDANALRDAQIDQNSEETTKLMSLFCQQLKT